MITFFTCPKSFKNSHIAVIQRNAITSWKRLHSQLEIILMGNEEGVKEIGQDFNLKHVPEISCNEFGTPFVNDIFNKAQNVATLHLMCYVNTDIILMSDFMRAIHKISSLKGNFLMVGRRSDLEIKNILSFNEDIEEELRKRVLKARVCSPRGIDYFIFPKGLWGDIPAFALGRFWWDNWLLYRARSLNAKLIDATSVITAVHQKHDYSNLTLDHLSHLPEQLWFQNPEARKNYALGGNKKRYFIQINDATHQLTPQGIRRSWRGTLYLYSFWDTYISPWVDRLKRRMAQPSSPHFVTN